MQSGLLLDQYSAQAAIREQLGFPLSLVRTQAVAPNEVTLFAGIAPSGALLFIEASLSFAGGLAPTSEVLRRALITLASSITPTSAVFGSNSLLVGGVVTPAGTIPEAIVGIIGLQGSHTPVSTVQSSSSQDVVAGGSVAPAGGLTLQARATVAGGVGPTGAAALQGRLATLNGSVGIVGALFTGTSGVFSGTTAPVGSFSAPDAPLSALFVAAQVPVGVFSTVVVRTLSGILEPSGVYAQQTGGGLLGAVTPSGSLSVATASNRVAGRVLPNGRLTEPNIVSTGSGRFRRRWR